MDLYNTTHIDHLSQQKRSESLKTLMANILLLLLMSTLSITANAQCPVSGCSPNRCYCSQQSISIPQEPKLVWHKKSTLQLSSQGCVANGRNIVCPIERETALKEK